MVIDTTGLKVYGEGEWHVKQHKASRRRTWRKLHIAPVSQEILDVELTDSRCGDSTMFPVILNRIKDPIKKVWAAYDHGPIYKLLYQKKIYPIIPPRHGAQPCYSYYGRSYLGTRRFIHTNPPLYQRDKAINFISQFIDYKK